MTDSPSNCAKSAKLACAEILQDKKATIRQKLQAAAIIEKINRSALSFRKANAKIKAKRRVVTDTNFHSASSNLADLVHKA